MWRAGTISRSRYTDPSPNAEAASLRSAGERGRQVVGAYDAPHPPTAAAGGCLDQEWEADPPGLGDDRCDLRQGGRRRPVRAFPGTAGTPTSWPSVAHGACRRAHRSARDDGPTNTSPASSTAEANAARSARNP